MTAAAGYAQIVGANGGEPGARVVGGRYVLRSEVGRGGMGRVWRADDTFLERQVAVKEVQLPAHLDDHERERIRARVLREARAAARLHHPVSVDVYDVVEEDGCLHLVMEFVDAPNLAQVVQRDGPLPVEDAARVGVALLGALGEAHEDGVVHRDVKPANVLLPDDGTVRLADFGIASIKDDPSITATGLVLGSPSYMAPEQAAGEEVGPPTDIWGLGATLYFAVEGVPPFGRGEALPTMHAVLHEPPRPTQSASELEPVLGRLLAKDPAQRPEPSEAMSDLLQVEDHPAPGQTRALGRLAPAVAGLQHRRRWALPAAAAAFALIALTVTVIGGDSGTPAKAGSVSGATTTVAPSASEAPRTNRAPARQSSPEGATVETSVPASESPATTELRAATPVETTRPAPAPTTPSTIDDSPATTAPSPPTSDTASETP